MEVQAITKNVRMSAQKNAGSRPPDSRNECTSSSCCFRAVPRKSARVVAKTLKSAIANAEHNNNARPESLVVKMAVAGHGPVMKRFIPKARGSAGPILKRSCHVKIVVSDLS